MKRVILTSNPYRDKGFQSVRAAQQILRGVGLETRVCLPFDVDHGFELPRDIRFTKLEKALPESDVVICFGGDGTILHTAKAATRHGLPILGVNIGTLGFMAELESTELSMLKHLATGEYTLDRRMMLDVTVRRGEEIIYQDICLNDVVITKGAIARVVHLGVECDGVAVMQFSGDGVIVATPTGSTAYSLSAGGPVMEPDAKGILVTPICAHDTASRCIVASEKRVIGIRLTQNVHRNAFVSVDGGRAVRLNLGDHTTVCKSRLETCLIRLKDRSFYDIVNSKFQIK